MLDQVRTVGFFIIEINTCHTLRKKLFVVVGPEPIRKFMRNKVELLTLIDRHTDFGQLADEASYEVLDTVPD